jgi:hypothetical protein
MIKLSKKSLLLFVVALASVASASSASAATFDGVGQHTLTSSNLRFTTQIGFGTSCSSSVFEVNVPASGATATVTSATFSGCVGTGGLSGTADISASGFPWEVTTLGVANTVTIDGVRVHANVTSSSTTIDLSGSLTNGVFNCTTHVLEYNNAGDLTATITTPPPETTLPATVSGTLTDDQGTLCPT